MATDAFAFDKQRKGFILGMGLGPGYTSCTESEDSSGQEVFSESKSKFAFFTDFKIGYAPSNKLMIYWLSKGAWFGRKDTLESIQDGVVTPREEDITVLTGIGGLGITYFFRPKSPSLFITVGGGFSAWTYPFQGTDPWTGLGFAGGLGYEFRENYTVEISALYGQPSRDEDVYKFGADLFSVGVTLNVVGY
jgi:hypothetical protein